MKPSNKSLKISMKLLHAEEQTTPKVPFASPLDDPKRNIQIKRVVNNLPYSCVIEIVPPVGIDWVYYAALDSQNNKLFYKSEYPNRGIPVFSIHDLNTTESEFRFVCWPVIGTEIGNPTYFGPIPTNAGLKVGSFDLAVNFEKEADQKLFQQVKPLIEKHYGKAALPGLIQVQEDNNDIFIPSSNTIKLSPNRNNLVHELIHANRKQLLFANKNYKFDEETEMIEEFFAEGVSNMIKDELNQQENDYLQKGAVYGSTLGYNYDFRITDPSLITQNLQSSWGGILTLENSRYFLASEAYHKIAIEYLIKTGKYFGKEFNQLYYQIIQKEFIDPSRDMFFAICEHLLPTVEDKPTRQWLIDQKLFNATIEPGEKIFMDIEDYYTSDEWLGITNINLYKTFENGSDWAHGERRYNMNGKTLKIELVHLPSGRIEYAQTHQIPEYKNGFGAIKLFFHYKENSAGVRHFHRQDVARNITSFAIRVNSGLYRINLSSENASRSYFRLMGKCMWEGKGKISVVNPFQYYDNTSIQLVHQNISGKKTVVQSQLMKHQHCAFEVPFIQNKNCEPGILQIQINVGGIQQNFQRNIGYGGTYGGHQFLIGADPKDFFLKNIYG